MELEDKPIRKALAILARKVLARNEFLLHFWFIKTGGAKGLECIFQ
jgi:hypothetical protein